MTTVGGRAPTTTEGKIVASVVMVVGTGFFAVLTGAIARRFLIAEVTEVEQGVVQVGAAEEDVLQQVRDIARRLQDLERALARP